VWRYIECDNIILLVIGLEFFRVVVIVAVKDEQLIFALYTKCCVEIEVPNLIYAFLIGSLAIIGCCNTLGLWEVVLFILVGEMVLLS